MSSEKAGDAVQKGVGWGNVCNSVLTFGEDESLWKMGIAGKKGGGGSLHARDSLCRSDYAVIILEMWIHPELGVLSRTAQLVYHRVLDRLGLPLSPGWAGDSICPLRPTE